MGFSNKNTCVMCLVWTGWSHLCTKKPLKTRDSCQKRRSLKTIPAEMYCQHKKLVSRQLQENSVSFSACLYLYEEFSSRAGDNSNAGPLYLPWSLWKAFRDSSRKKNYFPQIFFYLLWVYPVLVGIIYSYK